MADWARLANTTINEYLRGEEVQVMRNRKILALLQDRGRVTFNHSGLLLDWKVRNRRAPMIGFIDGDTLTFRRQNRWRTAQLDWRGYASTDQITNFEKEKNKGDAAIVKVFSQLGVLLTDDLTDQLGDEPYIDGNATGNTKRFHGAESFLANSGAATNGYIANPNSTYANLKTNLGNYGGAWTGTWQRSREADQSPSARTARQ